MSIKQNSIRLIQQLADAPGPSGFEDAVVAAARPYAEELGRVEEDFLRNLYIHRAENTGNKPVVMIDAHSDEVGMIVQSINANGTLRFLPLGGWNPNVLAGCTVLVRNALGQYIPGIIASKPVHFMTPAEKANAGTSDTSGMVIDVGSRSFQETKEVFHIRIGEPVVVDIRFRYDEANDLMFGKAFDCRIGCAALLEAMRRLKGVELPCDVIGVLSSQEEIGHRSSKVAVYNVQPDIGIVMEGCPADDTFLDAYSIQTALRKGPMLRHMDVSAICAPRYQRFALNLAEEKGIPVQEAVRQGGGNNAAEVQTMGHGAPAIVVGIPVRYAHSPNGISCYHDFEAAVQLVVELLKALTPEVIASF